MEKSAAWSTELVPGQPGAMQRNLVSIPTPHCAALPPPHPGGKKKGLEPFRDFSLFLRPLRVRYFHIKRLLLVFKSRLVFQVLTTFMTT